MRDNDPQEEVSDEMIAEHLADATRRIEEATRDRDTWLLEARRRGWTQQKMAAAARISQQAVSKRLKHLRARAAHPSTDG